MRRRGGLRVRLYGRKDTLDRFSLYGVDIQFAIHVTDSFSYGGHKGEAGKRGNRNIKHRSVTYYNTAENRSIEYER